MNRRWWLNLGLLTAIGILAAIAVFKPGTEKPIPKPALTALRAEAVQKISIERPGQPPVVLEKAGEQWRLTAPLGARASRYRVENLARIAGAESEARLPLDEAALGQYGLDKPLVSVRLDDELIQFGGLHPLNQQQYVRYRDGVHLIGAHYLQAAAAGFTDFIDTALFEDGREPTAFRLPGLTLTRVDGRWKLAPENRDIGSDRVMQFVKEWQHARALSVSRYDGKPAKQRVTIEFATAEPDKRHTLEIGIVARTPQLILARKDEGLQYHFPADAATRILNISEK
ncbi:MAG: DUF4340 domain-containing protein [Gammaproteobacteria bacterium]|nr:DUF4340 domain-containing protein [Gammaproteobacteria bacterium]